MSQYGVEIDIRSCRVMVCTRETGTAVREHDYWCNYRRITVNDRPRAAAVATYDLIPRARDNCRLKK